MHYLEASITWVDSSLDNKVFDSTILYGDTLVGLDGELVLKLTWETDLGQASQEALGVTRRHQREGLIYSNIARELPDGKNRLRGTTLFTTLSINNYKLNDMNMFYSFISSITNYRRSNL